MYLHHLDSSDFSLKEFCFISRARNKFLGAQGKFRDVIDALRTVYWFHGLRIRTQANKLYQMEKQLEPEAFGESRNGVRYRRNKWCHYHIGRHTPSRPFVTKIGERYEGSELEFDHVLWDVLRLEHPAIQHVGGWIQRLEPRVQSLLWQKPEKHSIGRIRQRTLGQRQLKLLERYASIDALACLTLLLREAYEMGNDSYAFELSRWICRMLVLTGKIISGYGIARPLHEFYEFVILPLGARSGLRYSLAGVSYRESIGWLSHALYHLDGVHLSKLSREQIQRFEQKILSGDYGFDYFFLLNPILIPVDLSLASENPLHQLWMAQNNLRLWTLKEIRNYKQTLYPPEDLLSAEAAARRAVDQYQKLGQR